jgi:DNA-binding MarR family transcriptional regulator
MASKVKSTVAAKANSNRPSRNRKAGADPEAYRVEAQVGHLLRRAHQRHTALFAKHMGPEGLTPTQWAALFKLRELGSASQKELGRLTAVDAATMQVLVQRLIQRGMVSQKQDARDRRRSRLRLTRAGAAFVDACLPRAQRITRLTLEPLTPEQQKAFVRLLSRMT